MTVVVTNPVVGIHGVYPDKLNSHYACHLVL